MINWVVVLDACVLYPAPLRDLLLRLALAGLFRAKWTKEIQDEWIRNLLNNRADLSRAKLERTRTLMNSKVVGCLIEGYEYLSAGLRLPDCDDRHVLAAAIKASADIILTFNLKDFPESALQPHGIKAVHPDEFVVSLLELKKEEVLNTIYRLRQALCSPPQSATEYIETLKRRGLERAARMLRTHEAWI